MIKASLRVESQQLVVHERMGSTVRVKATGVVTIEGDATHQHLPMPVLLQFDLPAGGHNSVLAVPVGERLVLTLTPEGSGEDAKHRGG